MGKFYFMVAALLLAANQLLGQDKAVITGHISAPLSDNVELITYPTPLLPEGVETTIPLTDKTFRVEVPLQHPMVAELQHGEEVVQVYLEPGYELQLKANGKGFLKSIKYEGRGANENNYLATYTYRFEEEEEYQALPDNVKLGEGEFAKFLDYRRGDQLSSFDKYAAKYKVSETFRDFLLAEIHFSYALDKLNYHPLRQQILRVALTKPSRAFYSDLDKLNLHNPANLLSSSFLSFLRKYTDYLTQESGYSEKSPLYYKSRFDVAGQLLQGQARLVAQAQVLKQSVQQGHLKYTAQMLEAFKAENTNQTVNAYFDKLLQENSTLVAGGVAPDFRLVNISGDTVSLSDFKGNLVYLNFWRPDCGLCLVELPNLQQLIGKVAGQRVVFLNVAVTDSEAQWRQLVQEKKLQGEHLLAKGAAADVARHYGLKDVPAYFLLDEEGRFISVKARRPSDHEATNEILQHLQVRQASLK